MTHPSRSFHDDLERARRDRLPRIALRRANRRANGELDDVVVGPVETFRAEMLGGDTLWLACHLPTGERITWHVHAVKRGVLAFDVVEMPHRWQDWDTGELHEEAGP